MIVKIGNKYYDSKQQPIMLVLNDTEKSELKKLGKAYRYTSCPHTDADTLREWMDLDTPVTKVASEQTEPWTWKYSKEPNSGITKCAVMLDGEIKAYGESPVDVHNMVTALNQSPVSCKSANHDDV